MSKKQHIANLATMSALRNKSRQLAAAAFIAVAATPAFASTPSGTGSSMPWEDPLNMILQSIQGPVARAFILISIVVCGLGMAFGEHGSGFKKVMGIAFGGSLVVGALTFVGTLFGASF